MLQTTRTHSITATTIVGILALVALAMATWSKQLSETVGWSYDLLPPGLSAEQACHRLGASGATGRGGADQALRFRSPDGTAIMDLVFELRRGLVWASISTESQFAEDVAKIIGDSEDWVVDAPFNHWVPRRLPRSFLMETSTVEGLYSHCHPVADGGCCRIAVWCSEPPKASSMFRSYLVPTDPRSRSTIIERIVYDWRYPCEPPDCPSGRD